MPIEDDSREIEESIMNSKGHNFTKLQEKKLAGTKPMYIFGELHQIDPRLLLT
jgi:hypothetical protein